MRLVIALFLLCLSGTAALAQDKTLDLPVPNPNDNPWDKIVITGPPLPPELPTTPEIVPPPVFFENEIPLDEDNSLVYVLDFSCSMAALAEPSGPQTWLTRWQVVAREATSSIKALSPSIKFSVVVFGTNRSCSVAMWRNELTQATESNKANALQWLGQFREVRFYGGETPAAPAVLIALPLRPSVILMLTDGRPSDCGVGGNPWETHRALIRKMNVDMVRIDIMGVGIATDQYAREFAMGVASDSGGTFMDVR